MTIHMTHAELAKTGRRLYGECWKGLLASAIGRSRFSVYRWARSGVTCKPAAELIRQLAPQHKPQGDDR